MYEDKTPEKIKAEIIGEITGDWDTREGGFANDLVGTIAIKLADVYTSLNELQYIIWPDKTSGPYLDMEAEDLGITPRKAGTKSTVILEIAGTPGYTVNAGKVFMTIEGHQFISKEKAVIPQDSIIQIVAEAMNVGELYNVGAGSILYQVNNDSAITSVSNPLAAIGGADPESDAALFAREDAARKKPRTSGNKNDYEAWALEVSGIGAARCFPLYNGRGTVMVLVADESGQPVEQPVIDACTAHIESCMPCGGIELTVLTPELIAMDISATVQTDGKTQLSEIRSNFVQALSEHFSAMSFKGQVVYNYVSALLMSVTGVTDRFSLTINGQSENITLSDIQIPSVGEVTIT